MKITQRIVGLTSILAVVLTGCSTPSNEASPSSSPSVSHTPVPLPTWPLTGVASKNASKTKPVLVIKVENDPGVRPQSGLDKADMVFEELVEGGITRFATVFQSRFPKELGPVRSVRHVDASIASPMADFFVFSGGARPTISYIKQNVGKGIYILTEGAPGMHRTNYHYAPHNLFLYPQTLITQSKKTSTPTDGFFVREAKAALTETPAPGPAYTGESASPSAAPKPKGEPKPISGVNLRFSGSEQPRWSWSTKLTSWVRSEFGTPSFAKSGARISAKNIVIIRTQTTDAGYRDPAGNFVPRTILTGTGTGYVLTRGLQMPITWSKSDVHSQMTLKSLQGKVVTLFPGNVWVELVPINDGQVTFVKRAKVKKLR